MARVLIVEDQPELARIAHVVVTRAGHEARVAFDGAGALALLAAEAFDVVLVDGVLPGGMDGVELVRTIRATPGWTDIPLVAVTARALPEEQEAMREAGVGGLVVKPYRAQELRDAIDQVLVVQ